MGCSGFGQQGAVGCLAGGRQSVLLESEWTTCPEQDTWTKIWGWFSIGPQPEPNLVLIKASWSTVISFHPLPICPHQQAHTHTFPLLAHLWLQCYCIICNNIALHITANWCFAEHFIITMTSCVMSDVDNLLNYKGSRKSKVLRTVIQYPTEHRDLTTTKINSLCWSFDWSCLYDAFSLHCWYTK